MTGVCRGQVPAVLPGGFKSFVTPLPQSAAAWDKQKPVLRGKISNLFGDLPPLFTPDPTIHSREQRSGYTLEKFTFVNGVGDTVYGYTLIPKGHKGRGPAILYPANLIGRRRLVLQTRESY